MASETEGFLSDAVKMTVDTLRLLTQSQNEFSRSDIVRFWTQYVGPVEGADYMLSQESIQSEFDISDDKDFYVVLSTALREYGADPTRWERFVRFLLRKRADLHLLWPIIRRMEETDYITIGPEYPCKVLEKGSPLDELFGNTETPFEGKAAADGWLDIISSEGRDIVVYLERESALHASQMQLTSSSSGR